MEDHIDKFEDMRVFCHSRWIKNWSYGDAAGIPNGSEKLVTILRKKYDLCGDGGNSCIELSNGDRVEFYGNVYYGQRAEDKKFNGECMTADELYHILDYYEKNIGRVVVVTYNNERVDDGDDVIKQDVRYVEFKGPSIAKSVRDVRPLHFRYIPDDAVCTKWY